MNFRGGGARAQRNSSPADTSAGPAAACDRSCRGVHEETHEIGIELRTGAALELGQSRGGGARLLVGALGGDGVEGIGDGDDARAERNVLAAQAVGT